jgi:hypothetical protein
MDPAPGTANLTAAIAEAMNQMVHATQFARLRDAFMEQYWAQKRESAANPLVKRGVKFFSQNDEDGILLEICRRLDLEHGVFVELGVGSGLENNTLILLMHGWRGVWLGGDALAFEVPDSGPLLFQQSWITRDNCHSLVAHGLSALGESRVNVLSVDVDGNDLYVLKALLQAGIAPDVVVVEYNAKFPPPVRWVMRYDPEHVWDMTDYQGASLQSLADLMDKFGYRLVACNITGSNAFFVAKSHAAKFSDVPTDIGELFMKAEYIVIPRGHETSPRTIARFLAEGGAGP